MVTGRGNALGPHTSCWATAVAEIEVDRETGMIVVKHIYGAIDAGQTVNPAFVENQISGILVQAVTFCVRSLPLEFPVVKESLLFSQAYGTIGEGFGSVFTRSRGWL